MGDLLEVCPECDHPRISRNNQNPRGEGRAAFGCQECGAAFDEPDVREKVKNIPPGSGSKLAARLAAMDADDVGGAP